MTEKSTKKQELGERLKIAIKKSRLTQYEVAHKIGKDPTEISRWVGGRAAPHVDILVQIIKITGCDAGWLLTGQGDMLGSDHHTMEEEMSDYNRMVDEIQEVASEKELTELDAALGRISRMHHNLRGRLRRLGKKSG